MQTTLHCSAEMDGREIYIMMWDITHVYADPCQWEGTLEEVGPTVDDLAAALEQQPMRDATVSDVELDGFAGKLVTMSVPDDMDSIGPHRTALPTATAASS